MFSDSFPSRLVLFVTIDTDLLTTDCFNRSSLKYFLCKYAAIIHVVIAEFFPLLVSRFSVINTNAIDNLVDV